MKVGSNDGAHREIERKFLVSNVPFPLEDYERSEIEQGYLGASDGDLHVRVRRTGVKYVLAVKQGRGAVKTEVELDLSESQFAALWPLTEGCRVRKTRYEISLGRRLIELDIFHDRLDGFAMAEVEFDSEEEAYQFEPPEWFGKEVTEDLRYSNFALASNPAFPVAVEP